MKRSTYDITEVTEVISNMSSLKRGIQCVVIHLLRISNPNTQMIISGLSTNFSITSWKYGPTARLWFQLRYFEEAIKKINDKIYATNIEILHKFFKDPRICICDNSGLCSRGNPIGRFMSRNDNTHLSYDGNNIFASNLKSSIVNWFCLFI
jgi:hypothetical protein